MTALFRLALAALLPCAAAAAQQTWTFDQTTSGQDVHWLSPTAVDPGAVGYDATYQLDLVEVKVKYLFLTLTLDVTDQVPPEVQTGGGNVAGPAPILLFSDSVTYPLPPDPPSMAATLTMGLNGSGQGYFDATNITLGSVQVDFPPFGTVTAQLLSVRIKGSLTVDETRWLDLGLALAGSAGEPSLSGAGELIAGQPMSIGVAGALSSAPLTLVVGLSRLDAPFKGGVLVPAVDLLVSGLVTDGAGGLSLGTTWPTGVPAGFTFYLQGWIADPAGPLGFAATNGLSGTAQ